MGSEGPSDACFAVIHREGPTGWGGAEFGFVPPTILSEIRLHTDQGGPGRFNLMGPIQQLKITEPERVGV